MSLAQKCKRVSERQPGGPEPGLLRRTRSLDLRGFLRLTPPHSPARTDMLDASDDEGTAAKFKSRVKALHGRLKTAASSYSLSHSPSLATLRRESLRRRNSNPRHSLPAASFPTSPYTPLPISGGMAGVGRELELCVRYLVEVTRSGKVELMPASLAALFEIPLQVKSTTETGPYVEAYNRASIALLKWADNLFVQRIVKEPSEPLDTSDDLIQLEKLTARLKQAFQDLLDASNGVLHERLSKDSGAVSTSVSSLESHSDLINNNAKPPPIPPRRNRSAKTPPRDSGVFDRSDSPQGIVEEPSDSDDDYRSAQDVSVSAGGRLFSDGSMTDMLAGLEISKHLSTPNTSLLAVMGAGESVDQSEESKEETKEHKTTTEEEEDEKGSKKTRKVTSSRQVFSSSSNKSSVVTSSSGDLNSIASLQKLLQESKGKGSVNKEDDGSFTVTETASFRAGGRSNHRTLFETLDDDEWPPKGFGAFSTSTPNKTGKQSAIQSSQQSSQMSTSSASTTSSSSNTRSMDALAKRHATDMGTDFADKADNSASKGPRVRRTEEVVMEKAASKSVNREARLNGELVGKETLDALDASKLNMTKASTFDQAGTLIDVSGGGTVDETGYRRHHLEDLRGRKEGDAPPIPPRKHNVDTYIGVFRPPDSSLSVRSEDGSKEAEFGTSALASYVVLRNKLCLHEEALRQKRTTFTFSNTDPSGLKSASSNGTERVSGDSGEAIADFFEGGPGYLNLKNFWKQAQDMIQFPKKLAIEAAPPPLPQTANSSPSAKRRGEMPVAEVLGAVDASEYLLMRKSSLGAAVTGEEVRGGSVDALVVYATQPGRHILIYQEAFLITFRTFIGALDLIRRLIWRYTHLGRDAEEDVAKRKAARNSFCLLVRVVHDLGRPDISSELVEEVNGFIYRLVEENNLALARLLRSNLIPRLAILHPSPPSPLPSSAKVTPLTGFLEFRSQELAEQLTVLDSGLFQKIQPAEMLEWSREQSEIRAPNLVAFTEHFNRISFWVRSVVIRQPDHKHRDHAATKFINIMKHLRKLGNFNSYLAILSALDSGPLRRLDWSRGVSEGLAEHAVIMDSSSSFKNYRCALADTKPPCLPYIYRGGVFHNRRKMIMMTGLSGLILQDLTFVHIGNQDRLNLEQTNGAEGILNFGKRWQQFTILDAVRRFKSWPYKLSRDDQVLSAFCNFVNPLSEDDIWEVSETLKPRSSARAKATL